MQWLKDKLRHFLGIEQDKRFLLEYGDATASRVDKLEQ